MTLTESSNRGRPFLWLLAGLSAFCVADTAPSLAQSETPPPAAAASAEADPETVAFSREELRTLLAPIALYPDALLAQVLPATAYPVDIVMAARWLDKNQDAVAKGDFTGADAQGWDPSVKALVRFPDVIRLLNEDLDKTSDLGDAFVNQPDDVAAVIQALRREAQAAGSLKSTPQQTVTVEQQGGADYVVIAPADPEVIYVPTYDPAVVYDDGGGEVAAGLIGFGVGVAVGAAIDNAWDWGRGWVYPPRWPGYPGYRPGYRPGGINNGTINIGNDVNIGSGNIRPWRPDADRYHPGQGTKPGLAQRPGKGGIADRQGGAGRPGSVGERAAAGGDRLQAARDGGGLKAAAGEARTGGAAKAAGAKAAEARTGGAKVAGTKAASAKAAGNKAAGNKAAGAKQMAGDRVAKKPVAANRLANRPVAARPQNMPRPSGGSAFSGARYGGGASGFSNRGAASRHSVSRPMGGGGGRGGGAVMRGGRR